MIKFFRRIRQQLLSEGNTTKYLKYAIGEIILVVIGILIALQINNWNETRKDKLKETSYLQDLKLDLVNCQKELDRVIKKTNRTKNCATEAIKIITLKSKTKDEANLDYLLIGADSHSIFSSTEGVINDILSSGKLDLIQNENIRTYVSGWKANLSNLRGWESVSLKSFDNFGEILSNVVDFTKYMDGKALIPEENKVIVFKNLKFRNLLDNQRHSNNRLNGVYQEKKIEIDSIINLIKIELKKHIY